MRGETVQPGVEVDIKTCNSVVPNVGDLLPRSHRNHAYPRQTSSIERLTRPLSSDSCILLDPAIPLEAHLSAPNHHSPIESLHKHLFNKHCAEFITGSIKWRYTEPGGHSLFTDSARLLGRTGTGAKGPIIQDGLLNR